MVMQQGRRGNSGSRIPGRTSPSRGVWLSSAGSTDPRAWVGHPNVAEVIQVEGSTSGDYVLLGVRDEALHTSRSPAPVRSGALSVHVERTR